ncbi:solute carrier organic anion transporter family member 74D isoform X2 [Tribolium castaneum]|uniref:Solute carrier organic anion transporter family member 1C1-like Protein n=1 Tax=Tribolium castaneum TaxID=7070 RepID=D6W894_TRICA|nr:PREDICTED: solute carrier organic anion transporter family member 1A6 isoform X2 [Tribolium castaneum]EFA10914.2 Solute carrier organic anion transporter family member 1C1-like Protein [Tribolium castaneum]|eukprot:XP_008199025.2 PREDICTED: solute carrier organic anion transporter family member 1A6 isoform X2 [Tribolium castaneum]
MVHPSELFRTNSNEERTFSAPRNVTLENQFDCGLTNLPILNRCCNLERLATPKVFLAFLSLVGFLQGITIKYFRETAKFWGDHYNISQNNIDWLIYTNEFFVGLCALLVAYYGNRIHRISWIGGLTIFQAISSGILVIPEVYRKNYNETKEMPGPTLCSKNGTTLGSEIIDQIETNYIALVILCVFQMFFAMVSVSFISHGITYLDDNTSYRTSPRYIAIALACKELGQQAGLYLSWIPTVSTISQIFVHPVWLSIASVTFVSGVLISMFPKYMPSTLIRAMSASIVDLASGHQTVRRKPTNDGFFKTLFRLLKNPILMVNISSIMIMESGLINFNIFEKYFNQSRFQISYDNDTSYTQITTNILKQPLVAVSMIACGLLTAKAKHSRSLAKWNIAAIILVVLFFGSTAFLKCNPTTKYEDLLDKNMCKRCNCTFDSFEPVCIEDKTYYSPCCAGCKGVTTMNSRKIFTSCIAGMKADEGPCNQSECDLFYALSQANRVITTALLASTIITNIIINMRCILPRDKAMALGLEATFSSLVPYLPVKAIYGAVAEHYCIYRENNVCKLYSKSYATFLSLCSMGFMILSLLLAVVVLILLKLTPLDYVDEDEDDVPVELEEVNRPVEGDRLMGEEGTDEVDSSVPRKTGSANSVESMPESLLDMENVGDDHDSIDSAPRNRILESNL